MSATSCDESQPLPVQLLCIGSGRFLRGLLLPLLQLHRPSIRAILLQPRGHDVSDAITAASNSYESDTVDRHGVLSTVTVHNVSAAFSGGGGGGGGAADYEAHLSLPAVRVELIAVGVTEAGLAEASPAMVQLARSLELLQRTQPQQRVSIVDLDNVSGNGDKIKRIVCAHFAPSPLVLSYIASHVTFHNSVVDRITAARPDNALVPRGEPIPHKGLIIEDLRSLLPQWLLGVPHVIVRRGEGELLRDAQLKLRCANATHTAVVYCMALAANTSIAAACAQHPQLLHFLDRLYDADIASLPRALQLPEAEVKAFYTEWRARVAAPSVDMSPFWVAQNAVAKIGERLVPSIVFNGGASPFMTFVLASILRYLTPVSASGGNVFVGKLDASLPGDAPHAYVPALAAQGSGYTFLDGSGVAQRLLGNFTASRDEQEAAVIDALKLVPGWSAVDPSVALQVVEVYCPLVDGECALERCLKLASA